jgi:integrase
VTTTFAGIRRAHRRPLAKKTALVLDRLLPAIEAIPETLPGLRDRALLLVGFAAALRPSEIAGLTFAHMTRDADGIELFLPGRKNDQDARGTKLWLPKGRTALCPVAALEAWLAAAARRQRRQAAAATRALPARQRADRHRFDRLDRQALDRARRARRRRFCRAQPPRGDLERRRRRRPYRPPQAVLRSRLAQER